MSGPAGVIPEVDVCPICSDVLCVEHSDEERAEFKRRANEGQEELVRAGDAEQATKATRSAKALAKRDRDDLAWLLNDARGRRLMWGLISRGGIYQVGFVAAQGDHAGMAFLDGQKNIAIEYLHRCLKEQPALYAQMVKENGG